MRVCDVLVRYQAPIYDSARWEGFELRDDDIVVSTPPKCGTTWTQMICLLLIHQTPDLPAPVSVLAPWLDQLTRPRGEVVAELDAQPHRRVIKTHTPLDGLPRRDGVTFVCVGRDPRDVALSMDHHLSNMQLEAVVAARAAAAEIDGTSVPTLAMPPRLDDPLDRFWQWVDSEAPVTEIGSSLLRTLRHVEGFWAVGDGSVVMLHYDDLQADLAGEMRKLAARLGIDVPEDRWPTLVAAATFDAMRAAPSTTVPNGGKGLWRDERAFFHRGTSGQWRELLGEDDLARYQARVDSLVSADLAAWLHPAA